MAEAAGKYGPAYRAYLDHGNLARAARTCDVNENSLRDYARRHNWEGDRERVLEQRAEARAQVSAGADKLIEQYYRKPSAQSAEAARKGLELEEKVGGRPMVDDDKFGAFDGSREAFMELVMATIKGARRRGKDATVVQCLELLGRTTGITGQSKGSGEKELPIDIEALKALGSPEGPVFAGFPEDEAGL